MEIRLTHSVISNKIHSDRLLAAVRTVREKIMMMPEKTSFKRPDAPLGISSFTSFLLFFSFFLLICAPDANAYDGFWDKARDVIKEGEDAIIKGIGEEKAPEPAKESPPPPDQDGPDEPTAPPVAGAPSARTGAVSDAGGADNAIRILRGPGGKELIEVPMPKGFKPIRLVGLNGLPVAGFPVSERRGELNPRNWEQLDTKLIDIDVELVRLMQTLHLRWQPKLLQGLTYAEDFARTHLDEQSSAIFFPAGKTFGTNEFERKQLFEEFLRRYEEPLNQSLPATPFEFLYVEKVRIDTYDESRQAFPLFNLQGESGSIKPSVAAAGRWGNQTRIKVPDNLPVEPDQAQALLARLADERSKYSTGPPLRFAYLGVRLAIAGFKRDRQDDKIITEFETRSIGLFEDALLTRGIHEYPVTAQKAQKAQKTVSIDAAPLLPHLPGLYAMRDVDGFMDDEGIASAAKYLIEREQAAAEDPFRGGTGPMAYKCRDKLSIFEWAAARPELANGPLLDVLMQPAADWSFLNDETRYGLVPDHCVEVLVFPREKITGRSSDFAVSDLAPVYRKSLEAAIARLPATIYINLRLPAPTYDFSRKALAFESQPDGSYGSRGKPPHMLRWAPGTVEYLGPGEKSKSNLVSTVHAPKAAEGLAIYSAETAMHHNEPVAPPPVQPESVGSTKHGEDWRSSIREFRGERRDQPYVLAVDRLLEFPEFPLDPATAEQLITDVKGSYDKALRAIIVLDMDGARSVAPNYRAILYARLKQVVIATHDGREIAVLDASSFPDAVASYRQASANEQGKREAASL